MQPVPQKQQTNQDDIYGTMNPISPTAATPAQNGGNLYGQAIPPSTEQQQQPSIYGQMTTPAFSNAGMSGETSAPVENNVYGAPVSAVSKQTASNTPFGNVKLRKVEKEKDDDNEPEDKLAANEYSVMKHVSVADQAMLYDDADADKEAKRSHQEQKQAELYINQQVLKPNDEPIRRSYENQVIINATAAGQTLTQSSPEQTELYGNQQVVDAVQQNQKPLDTYDNHDLNQENVYGTNATVRYHSLFFFFFLFCGLFDCVDSFNLTLLCYKSTTSK